MYMMRCLSRLGWGKEPPSDSMSADKTDKLIGTYLAAINARLQSIKDQGIESRENAPLWRVTLPQHCFVSFLSSW